MRVMSGNEKGALGISWSDVACRDVHLMGDDFGEPGYYRVEIWLWGTADSIVCWPDAHTGYVTEYAVAASPIQAEPFPWAGLDARIEGAVHGVVL